MARPPLLSQEGIIYSLHIPLNSTTASPPPHHPLRASPACRLHPSSSSLHSHTRSPHLRCASKPPPDRDVRASCQPSESIRSDLPYFSQPTAARNREPAQTGTRHPD